MSGCGGCVFMRVWVSVVMRECMRVDVGALGVCECISVDGCVSVCMCIRV